MASQAGNNIELNKPSGAEALKIESLEGDDKKLKYRDYMDKALDRSRDTMPQIDEDNLNSVLIHFANKGDKPTTVKKLQKKLKFIKPTQNEIKDEKVLDMIKNNYDVSSRKFIISKDNYLVDGHHAWAKGLEDDPDQKVDVYKIDIPINELLRRSNLLKVTRKVDLNDNVKKSFDSFEDWAMDILKSKSSDTYTNYPASATLAAKKALKYKEDHPKEVKGMTRTGWARARQLANNEPISFDTVKRIAAFVRHKENSKINPEFKDEPWKDNGYIAWLGWGGTEMIEKWAPKIIKEKEEKKLDKALNDFLFNQNIK